MHHSRCWTTRVKMAITTLLATFVLCLGILQSVDAACSDTIMQSSGYSECIQSYGTFMSNAAGDTTLMCSAEGKAAMKCLTDYVNECPELRNIGGNDMGQMDAMCKALAGGGAGMGNPACAQVQTCVSGLAGMASAEGTPDNGGNMADLNMFQEQVHMMCGPMKETFMCLEKVEGDCPEMIQSMEQNIKIGAMDYEKLKEFVKKYCSSMPSDFGTNTCVKEELQSAKTNECVTSKGNATDTPTCSDFNAILECIPLEKCGSRYENSLRQVMSFYISETTSTECDLTSTSDSYPLRASFFTFFTAVLVLFKLI